MKFYNFYSLYKQRSNVWNSWALGVLKENNTEEDYNKIISEYELDHIKPMTLEELNELDNQLTNEYTTTGIPAFNDKSSIPFKNIDFHWNGNNFSEENLDFTDFIFPCTVIFQGQFNHNLNFENCIFLKQVLGGNYGISNPKLIFNGNISFNKTKFYESFTFESMGFAIDFKNEANFREAKFYKTCKFMNIIFSENANFRDVPFLDEVRFHHLVFKKEVFFGNHLPIELNLKEPFIFNNSVEFNNIQFKGVTHFTDSYFKKDVKFSWVIFEKNAWFTNTTFEGNTTYERITFLENADFEKVTFCKETTFKNVEFKGKAFFRNEKNHALSHDMFKGKLHFDEIIFEEKATFTQIIFSEEVIFQNITFKNDIDFTGSTFKQLANFKEAKFHEKQDTIFDDATFEGDVCFNKAHFLGDKNHFVKTKFKQAVNFSHTVFKNKVNFSEATFTQLPKLTGIEARGGIDLNKTDLPKEALGKLENTEDAQNTWHILYKAMQDEQRFDKVSEYFSYYNDARLQDENVSWLRKSVLKLYKWLSSYGASIFRPILALGISVLVFSLVYTCIISGYGLMIILSVISVLCFLIIFLIYHYFPKLKNYSVYTSFVAFGLFFSLFIIGNYPHSLYLSTQNMFPFISDNVVLLDKVFNPENGTDNKTFLEMASLTIENLAEEKQKYLWLLFPVRMIQFLFSTLCLFLFGLGVRNFLRLK